MSATSNPITPTDFADALTSLPLGSLYAKGAEIQNSISHLQRSNYELQTYINETPGGDKDCEDAVKENEVVIERMNERIELLKVEVEGRGHSWVGGEEEGEEAGNNNTTSEMNGTREANDTQGGTENAAAEEPRTETQNDASAESEDRGVYL